MNTQTLEFEKLNLEPISENELQEINGGILLEIGLVIFSGVVTDWAGFKRGLVEAFK